MSYAAVASERRLTGTMNSDDGFKSVSSVDRLSSLDPKQPPNLSIFLRPESVSIR
jgi:hypothetical protein